MQGLSISQGLLWEICSQGKEARFATHSAHWNASSQKHQVVYSRRAGTRQGEREAELQAQEDDLGRHLEQQQTTMSEAAFNKADSMVLSACRPTASNKTRLEEIASSETMQGARRETMQKKRLCALAQWLQIPLPGTRDTTCLQRAILSAWSQSSLRTSEIVHKTVVSARIFCMDFLHGFFLRDFFFARILCADFCADF